MLSLAVSSWTWLFAAGLGLLAVGILIQVTIVLIGRIKALGRALSAASDELNVALEGMRADLDRATEELAELRRRHEDEAGAVGG